MENPQCWQYLPANMGNFDGNVSLPEGSSLIWTELCDFLRPFSQCLVVVPFFLTCKSVTLVNNPNVQWVSSVRRPWTLQTNAQKLYALSNVQRFFFIVFPITITRAVEEHLLASKRIASAYILERKIVHLDSLIKALGCKCSSFSASNWLVLRDLSVWTPSIA